MPSLKIWYQFVTSCIRVYFKLKLHIYCRSRQSDLTDATRLCSCHFLSSDVNSVPTFFGYNSFGCDALLLLWFSLDLWRYQLVLVESYVRIIFCYYLVAKLILHNLWVATFRNIDLDIGTWSLVLLRNLNDLRHDKLLCDVTIVTGDDESFVGHSVVLAAGTVFRKKEKSCQSYWERYGYQLNWAHFCKSDALKFAVL